MTTQPLAPTEPVAAAAQPVPHPVTNVASGSELRPRGLGGPDAQRVLTGAGWRTPAELAGRAAETAADREISGAFGAVVASRMVTFGGRDYLEMTVSW